MTITTRFTELVGCQVPIQQAGMGAASTPELAAAVANAGGLGMLTFITDDLSADVDATLAATAGRPFGVNFLMPFFDRSLLEAVAHRVRLVEWFWGRPDPVVVGLAHDAGALAAWQVGSRDEATAAADAGCDLIVAQGVEARGHVRGTVGLLPLLDAVLGAVEVPVVAAGGIGTGRGVAAVLAAGASAARIGTRFVATLESGAHPTYKQALVSAAHAADTVLTQAFSVGWPEAPHRVLRSSVQAAEALDEEQAGDASGAGYPLVIPRFAVQAPNRATRGHIDAMTLCGPVRERSDRHHASSRRPARDRHRRRGTPLLHRQDLIASPACRVQLTAGRCRGGAGCWEVLPVEACDRHHPLEQGLGTLEGRHLLAAGDNLYHRAQFLVCGHHREHRAGGGGPERQSHTGAGTRTALHPVDGRIQRQSVHGRRDPGRPRRIGDRDLVVGSGGRHVAGDRRDRHNAGDGRDLFRGRPGGHPDDLSVHPDRGLVRAVCRDGRD
jgi:nitronate monooxygenase